MKELYISPELEILCLVSAQQIASSVDDGSSTGASIPFNDFMGGQGGEQEGVEVSMGDIEIEI